MTGKDTLDNHIKKLSKKRISPLELLPRRDLAEKLIELVLRGAPEGAGPLVRSELTALSSAITGLDTRKVRVVILGGGTGLSNVVGGDSRNQGWPNDPFQGLKNLFPNTSAVVCVTDDGGSTGELLKDLPLVSLGDLRHVLLSSIQKRKLKKQYRLNDDQALKTAAGLHALFNYRFNSPPSSISAILGETNIRAAIRMLPGSMRRRLIKFIETLFNEGCLSPVLKRPHCLGNLLLAAAVYDRAGAKTKPGPQDIIRGLKDLADLMGAKPDAVLPCATTPAQLTMLYTNGVLVTGEYKAGEAQRNCPVDRIFVEFAGKPHVPAEVMRRIRRADIIILAPGSLFTSVVPVLQVPGIAEAVRENRQALRILVANLWAQKGETDTARDDPGRRFYVSDMFKAYHRNIPGGVYGLFEHVLVLGLQDIPGSILQSYAVEDKVPIYLDREKVRRMGFSPVEARIFSQSALQERQVVHHDPDSLARAVHTMWAIRGRLPVNEDVTPPPYYKNCAVIKNYRAVPCRRLAAIKDLLQKKSIDDNFRRTMLDILWANRDIPPAHLNFIKGVRFIDCSAWRRSQEWDNVYSFFDPDDGLIKIRKDITGRPRDLETGLLVALGESLLGDYAAAKKMIPVFSGNGTVIGRIFELTLRPAARRRIFFSNQELEQYLTLSRMCRTRDSNTVYTRLINGNEGFTPPGLLFGLTYAWYLDNRHAAHIEYKMALMKAEISDLIPEQIKERNRRSSLIYFFRQVVFRHDAPEYQESPPLPLVSVRP